MRYPRYKKYKDSGIKWLGEVPGHWEIDRLKYRAKARNSNVDKNVNDDELPVRLCNYVDVYYNSFITSELNFMQATANKEEIEKFQLCPEDVIITKDSESWDDIAVPAYVEESETNIICGYHLSIIRAKKDKFFGKYLFWSFMSRSVRSQLEIASSGVTRFGLPKYAIDNALLPIPGMNEQQSIADFLDRETARIDALIEKKQKLIDLLQEKRTALINRAVTKGLDPNVKMKDSGIDWLGEVPSHWIVKKIKWESPVYRGASPRPIEDPAYFDEEGKYAWVRISDVTASNTYLQNTEQRLSDLGASLSVKLKPGSLFLSIAGSVGKPCITNIYCCIHDGFVYFPKLQINIKFLYCIFASGEPYKGLGKFGTQLNLNTETVGSIHIAIPGKQEQVSIVKFLDHKTSQIDELIKKINNAIGRMQEYRTALISAAVTGKIDVRVVYGH